MFTANQLRDMLTLQDKLNSQIFPDWRERRFAWHRAAVHELVEMQEHIGWKWWKNTQPNLAQAQLEAIDTWHFFFSVMLEATEDVPAAITTYNDLTSGERFTAFKEGTKDSDTNHIIDTLISQCAVRMINLPLMVVLTQRLELTADDVHRMYVAKNVLNTFRQNHGYKEGTYVKQWMGEEDNVHLDRFMKANPETSLEAIEQFLQTTYEEVSA